MDIDVLGIDLAKRVFQLQVLQGMEWVAHVADTLSRGLRAEVTRWTAPSFTESCWA
jgi:hypothetical protein